MHAVVKIVYNNFLFVDIRKIHVINLWHKGIKCKH